MKWWKRPIAMAGAASIAYHECIRGRRTATCLRCGRLTHADNDRCLCGSDVDENDHPSTILDDYDETDRHDMLAGTHPWALISAVKAVLVFSAVALSYYAVETGELMPAVLALAIIATVSR